MKHARRTTTTAIGLALAAALATAGCDSTPNESARGSTSVHTVAEREPRPTTTTAPPAKDRVELRKVDYSSMVPSASDVEALLPTYGSFVPKASMDDLAGYRLRKVCDRPGHGDAAGGRMQQYLSDRSEVSVTYAVETFEGAEATAALEAVRADADGCTMFADSNGSRWGRTDSSTAESALDGVGESQVAFTLVDLQTGVTIAEAYVQDGQAVYEIRMIAGALTPFGQDHSTMWPVVRRAMQDFVAGSTV